MCLFSRRMPAFYLALCIPYVCVQRRLWRANAFRRENGVEAYVLDFTYEQKAHRDLYIPVGFLVCKVYYVTAKTGLNETDF